MLVSDFKNTCHKYEGFQIWEIENLDTFFKGNQVLSEIFNDTYKILLEDLDARRSEIKDSDYDIVTHLLSKVGDKHFYVFMLHHPNHMELIEMQRMNIMNFGINIEEIKGDHIYVMIMDKKHT